MRQTPTTFNRHILLLKGAWKVLKKPGKIVENPWEDIQKRRAVAHSRRELTVEELMKVLTTAEGELQVLFALGIYTGQRLGDCALLDWSCIDLVRSFISLLNGLDLAALKRLKKAVEARLVNFRAH